MDSFVIRTYGRTELAQIYCSQSLSGGCLPQTETLDRPLFPICVTDFPLWAVLPVPALIRLPKCG